MVYNYRPLPDKQQKIAEVAAERLFQLANGDDNRRHTIYVSEGEESIALPARAVALLSDVLMMMARGHGITLFPRIAEVTTMEAADILNVSRPYVIKLLDAGEIPYRLVGRHRRIRLEDILDYKDDIDQKREAILDQMVAEAQELGLYD
ncbi:MAG: excisionase family DNA-binding protein [Chloroflexota bacterium]|nr:excisionase family DNA-binding protein [Chloroflexota bacterium]MDE2947737.1 excisionase family DNA-binding protein [Chloroflexota bacterium]